MELFKSENVGKKAKKPLADRMRPCEPGRVRGSGAPSGRGQVPEDPPGQERDTLHDLLGPLGRGEDEPGVAHRKVPRPAFRLPERGHYRHKGSEGDHPEVEAPEDDPFHRRVPPVQQAPAGYVPPLRRIGGDHPHRGDDGEPFLRDRRAPPVPDESPHPLAADRGGDRPDTGAGAASRTAS